MSTTNHTPVWCIYQHVDRDQSVKQIGEKLPDGRLGRLIAANVPVELAPLIAAAPETKRQRDTLLVALKMLRDCVPSVVHRAKISDRKNPIPETTVEHWKYAYCQANDAIALCEKGDV